jgi:hypothetical protein
MAVCCLCRPTCHSRREAAVTALRAKISSYGFIQIGCEDFCFLLP